MKDFVYSQYDAEAATILDAFLPHHIFDAHMHLTHLPFHDGKSLGFDDYFSDMRPLFGNRELVANAFLLPTKALADPTESARGEAFLIDALSSHPGNVGEVLVMPHDTADDIEKKLIHPAIRGLKCYHLYADRADTYQAGIEEYLPQAAWEIANEKRMCITLHMVRDAALADEGNRQYIKVMAKRYPDATLILAHAARAFASWTAIGTVDDLVGIDNIWYDFSSICESPAMLYILKKVGVKRCMWGSDYPICMSVGKAISLSDSTCWLTEKELHLLFPDEQMHTWLVGTENLMAVRQAAQIADLHESEIEDLFYNNAYALLHP